MKQFNVKNTVEAIQFDGSNSSEIIDILGFIPTKIVNEGTDEVFIHFHGREPYDINIGDWLVKGITGLFFAVTEKYFNEHYEERTT